MKLKFDVGSSLSFYQMALSGGLLIGTFTGVTHPRLILEPLSWEFLSVFYIFFISYMGHFCRSDGDERAKSGLCLGLAIARGWQIQLGVGTTQAGLFAFHYWVLAALFFVQWFSLVLKKVLD